LVEKKNEPVFLFLIGCFQKIAGGLLKIVYKAQEILNFLIHIFEKSRKVKKKFF